VLKNKERRRVTERRQN